LRKRDNPTPIAPVSGDEIGRKALRAYIKLLEKQKKDIRYSEKRYTWDKDAFDEILGFACKPFKTKTEDSSA
jgi:hypothetical protein